MGIIKNVKHKYRTSIAKKRLVAYETGETFKFNLYQCLQLLQSSWEAVSPDTIINCFGKAGFTVPSTITSTVPLMDDDLGNIIERMQGHIEIPEEVDAEMFVTLDDNIVIAEELMDKEIVDAQMDDREEETNSEETEEAVLMQ